MLHRAAHAMKQLSLDAICGKGIDRYFFSLYIASQMTGRDSPFLNMAMAEPWALWTSNVCYYLKILYSSPLCKWTNKH